MRTCLARTLLVVACGVLFCYTGPSRAADVPFSERAVGSEERDACEANLRTIYKAIAAYRTDKLDLPLWLSALVPKYLPDPNVLVCPVCRRTGAIEPPPLCDPKLPSSYLYEFSPVPLGDLNPREPSRTRREWKRRQMGVLGSTVPLVRCRHHSPCLNLAFDGKIFESPQSWELAFTNIAPLASLSASNLFASDSFRSSRSKYPPRPAKATPNQIDLTKFYTAALTENWLGRTNENLSLAPKGLQTLDGLAFDIRGIVQLAGRGLNKKLAPKVGPIPVRLKCKRLHFLGGLAGWSDPDVGARAGACIVKFAGNDARLEIPFTCGKEVAAWKAEGEEQPASPLKVAWTGKMPAGRSKARLFKTTWNNLAPAIEIESIELVSDPDRGGLFVTAVTAE